MLQDLRNLAGRRGPEQAVQDRVAESLERLFAQAERLDLGALLRLSRSFAAMTKDDDAGHPGLSAQADILAMDLVRPAGRTAFAHQLRKHVRRLVWDTWWVEDGPEADRERADREAAVEAISWRAWAILLADVLPPSLAEQLQAPWNLAMDAQT